MTGFEIGAAYSNEAELYLMGCLLIEPRQTVADIQGIVSISDFRDEDARAIYTATQQLVAEKGTIDAVLIQQRADANGNPVAVIKLRDAMVQCPTTVNAPLYAEIVHNAALDKAGRDIGFSLLHGDISASEAFEKLSGVLNGQRSKIPAPMEAAISFMDTVNAVGSGELQMYRSTGFKQLDDLMGGGLIRNGVITLAARPGVGKTTVGLAIAENVAAMGGKVLYESLEMSSYQIWARRTARQGNLDYSMVQQGKLNETEWASLASATDLLSKRQFQISDKPASMEDIERRARGMEPDLLVIDHMGLIKPAGRGPRYEEATNTSHQLKRLAQSLEIPILSLCQLNRSSEARSDKKPTLADLRDTGAIEEDSDAVILLHRPAMYAPEEEQPKPWETQDMELRVEKNRHGSTGKITMDFVGMTATVRERLRYTKGAQYYGND